MSYAMNKKWIQKRHKIWYGKEDKQKWQEVTPSIIIFLALLGIVGIAFWLLCIFGVYDVTLMI